MNDHFLSRNGLSHQLSEAERRQSWAIETHFRIAGQVMAQLVGQLEYIPTEEELGFFSVTSVDAASALLHEYGMDVKLRKRDDNE